MVCANGKHWFISDCSVISPHIFVREFIQHILGSLYIDLIVKAVTIDTSHLSRKMSFPISTGSDASNHIYLGTSSSGDSIDSEILSKEPSGAAAFEEDKSVALRCSLDIGFESTVDKDLDVSEDELVELELLRDEEIDAFVEEGLLSKSERWNIDRRDGYHFLYPEMTLDIITGEKYPVEPLTYIVTNTSLPRVIVDQLRVALRAIYAHDTAANSLEKWCKRASSESGCFEFKHVAFHLSAKTDAHLKHFRMDPNYWQSHSVALQTTDYHLSLERREYLYYHYDIDLIHDPAKRGHRDEDYRKYDPLNPDYSKKSGDLTAEQKLVLSDVKHQSEIKDSMFGIDPSSIHGHNLANSILGKTPEEICKKIPEIFRILHIESVIRSDLTREFQKAQDRIGKDLERLPITTLKGCVKSETRVKLGKRANEKKTLVDILTTPEMSFHCTREDLIPSIVRQGFLVPDGEGGVRCGSTYGEYRLVRKFWIDDIC